MKDEHEHLPSYESAASAHASGGARAAISRESAARIFEERTTMLREIAPFVGETIRAAIEQKLAHERAILERFAEEDARGASRRAHADAVLPSAYFRRKRLPT